MTLPHHLTGLTLGAAIMLASAASAEVDLTLFGTDAMVSAPETVDCTLTTGAVAQCAKFVVKYQPDTLEIGPFCPATLDETGGIWDWDGENPGVYRLNRAFFEMLNGLGYTFYDEAGNIYITDPGGGTPPAQENTCLMATADETVEMTLLIPTTPVVADTPTDLGTVAKVGIGLDGVPIFADAPSVLETGHMPALDTCGGHIDPGGWYHWHGTATDMKTVFEGAGLDAECGLEQSADAQFGYAFDGYAMFGSTEADGTVPTDLDACGGHTGPTAAHPEGEYHYHATAAFPNLPACLTGVQAEDNFSTTADNGIGSANGGGGPGGPGPGGGGPGGRMPPGFDQAAEALGVSPQVLMQAVNDAGGRNLDFAKAAAALGVTEEALRAALPPPAN
jgi:hypothetical protein